MAKKKGGGGNKNKPAPKPAAKSAPKPSSRPVASFNPGSGWSYAPPPPPPKPAPKPPKPAPKPPKPAPKPANNKPVAYTNAGKNPMGTPAKSNLEVGKSTNQKIQKQLSSAGRQVSYNEAAAVAKKLGVSIDRVYNQTARTGQNAKVGAAGFAAGYQPGANAKVKPVQSPSYREAYFTDQLNQQQAQFDQDLANLQTNWDSGPGDVMPDFDWDAWNAEMAAQQSALFESMDAMNAEFLAQQESWMAEREANQERRANRTLMAGGANPDGAVVRRKRKKRSQTSVGTNTGLGIGNGAGNANGLSLGGGNGGGNGLAIGRNK